MVCSKCGKSDFTELIKKQSKKEESCNIVSKIILCNHCEPIAKSILDCFKENAYDVYLELLIKKDE